MAFTSSDPDQNHIWLKELRLGRMRSMKERKYKGPDRVNHSINSFIIIITVATVFSPFIVIKKKNTVYSAFKDLQRE